MTRGYGEKNTGKWWGMGAMAPHLYASQHSWRVLTENNLPLKATDKVGGSLPDEIGGMIYCSSIHAKPFGNVRSVLVFPPISHRTGLHPPC
jgi:hypothetical protein